MKLSVILPCKDEEKSIEGCINNIRKSVKKIGIKDKDYEIIVSDNSKDNSEKIAKRLGARVVKHKYGYGDALITGLNAAKGKYLIFGDCDSTTDYSELSQFVSALKEYDFVIGNRFCGKMEKGAMPFANKYIGNPVLTFLLNKKLKTNFSDSQCGCRGLTRESFKKMKLKCNGMEFASEILKETARLKLKVKEIPVKYKKRIGKSKLNLIRDGFRHLKFIILVKEV